MYSCVCVCVCVCVPYIHVLFFHAPPTESDWWHYLLLSTTIPSSISGYMIHTHTYTHTHTHTMLRTNTHTTHTHAHAHTSSESAFYPSLLHPVSSPNDHRREHGGLYTYTYIYTYIHTYKGRYLLLHAHKKGGENAVFAVLLILAALHALLSTRATERERMMHAHTHINRRARTHTYTPQ